MTYEVAIPSYRRAATLARKTLPLLLSRGVPASQVRVFLSDPGETAAYREAISSAGIDPPTIIPGAPTVRDNRNLIAAAYPEGTRLVQIDDDISDMVERVNGKTLRPVADLDDLIEKCFGLLDRSGLGMWGLYPVPNPMFMYPKVTYDLRYCGGGMFGVINSHAEHAQVTLQDKEDFERSIRWYLAYGGIVRVNWVAWRTVGYAGAGGMQVDRTAARIYASAVTLTETYPELCTLNLTKRSGKAEVRLKDRRPAR